MNSNTLPKEVLDKCREKFCEKYNVSNTYFENVWRSQWRTIKDSMENNSEKSSIRVNNLGSFLLKRVRYANYIKKLSDQRKKYRSAS